MVGSGVAGWLAWVGGWLWPAEVGSLGARRGGGKMWSRAEGDFRRVVVVVGGW